MSTQNPKDEGSRPSNPAWAKGAEHGQPDDGRSAEEQFVFDGQLIERCLAGETDAWEKLYCRCRPPLLNAIELLLGLPEKDAQLIEEIHSRIWYGLLRNEGELLARYDLLRNSTFGAFLMGLAKIEIMRYRRAEYRRHVHEMMGGRRLLDRQQVSDWEVATMLEEFSATLTSGEREFLENYLMGPATEEDAEYGQMSPGAIWQRRRRMLSKLTRFFEDS